MVLYKSNLEQKVNEDEEEEEVCTVDDVLLLKDWSEELCDSACMFLL